MSADGPAESYSIPYGQDILADLARRLIKACAERLPILDEVVVLLPASSDSRRLRTLLLNEASGHGHSALIGPTISSLSTWLTPYQPPDVETLDRARGETMLVEALLGYRDLFPSDSHWALAANLLDLFDELGERELDLPAELSEFQADIARAYGIHSEAPSALGREAYIVFHLWGAWREQTEANRHTDAWRNRRQALATSLATLPPNLLFFAVCPERLAPAEAAWFRQLQQAGQLQLLVHGGGVGVGPDVSGYHPEAPVEALLRQLDLAPRIRRQDSTYAAFLNQALGLDSRPARQRAREFRDLHPSSPLQGRLHLFKADSAEAEARAIEFQVRRWLLEGKRRIAILTEDRRLGRRLRALLEQAGVALDDRSGWALSTTTAASTLERWLECIEEDFPHRALLEVLKSPFSFEAQSQPERLALAYRLERDVVRHENIGRGLRRYQEHLDYRYRRVQRVDRQLYQSLKSHLSRLGQAASHLQVRIAETATHPATLLEALRESLALIGLEQGLAADPAGERVLAALDGMRQAANEVDLLMSWVEFRAWLGRELERHRFMPAASPGAPVSLLNLGQSATARFDALVIAAAETAHLPGSPADSPFFNDAVRRELGLSTDLERKALTLHRFRRVLEAAPQVLLSHALEVNGEPTLPSPWLTRIEAFHRLTYGSALDDLGLAHWLAQPGSRLRPLEPAPRLTPSPAPLAPGAPDLLPTAVSASSHQRLLDCPYRFFASDCLSLRPLEEVREALGKADYGERVHLCLQAFHAPVKGLPGPFKGPLEASNRSQAMGLLEQISQRVFQQDLEDSFEHRGWLQRWLAVIPDYIDWQIGRQQGWRIRDTEQMIRQPIGESIEVKGRLDRVDQGAQGLAIIDYKSGNAPRLEQVLAGEQVQLPFYALLAGTETDSVAYLLLDKQVKNGAQLEGGQLWELAKATAARLEETSRQLKAGHELPAWGDAKACEYCEMEGLCRRSFWPLEQTQAN